MKNPVDRSLDKVIGLEVSPSHFKANVGIVDVFAKIKPHYVPHIRSCHASIKHCIESYEAEKISHDTYYNQVTYFLRSLSLVLGLKKDFDMWRIIFSVDRDHFCHNEHLDPNSFRRDVNELCKEDGTFRNTSIALAWAQNIQFDDWKMFTARAADARALVGYFARATILYGAAANADYKHSIVSRFNHFNIGLLNEESTEDLEALAQQLSTDDDDYKTSDNFRSHVTKTILGVIE